MTLPRLDFEKDLVKYLYHLQQNDSLKFESQSAACSSQFIHQFIDPSHHTDASTGFDFVLERILHAALVITNTESGFISLRNTNNKIEFKAGRNRLNESLGVNDFIIDRALIRKSIQASEPVQQVSESSATEKAVVKRQNVVVAPMLIHTDLVGLLYLSSYQTALSTASIKWRLFTIFLGHAAVALRNLQYTKLKEEFEEEKANLQKSLIQSDQMAMKGRMAAKIGHEINNFLSGIHANIDMASELVRNKGKKANILERLEKAQEMIMNMASLSNGLMSKEGMEANIEKSSVNQVVEKFVDFVKPIYKCSNVSIEKELDYSIPDVELDSGLMIQVLFNLVKNAVEAKANARILLKSRYDKNNKKVRLEIHDDGPGIPPEKREKIFEPLYTEKATGHGYGLAICKDIVKKHQGDIRVESRSGEGTTFIITLPTNVRDDYAHVEFDALERLQVRRAKSLNSSIKTKKTRAKTNPPYRPISNQPKLYGLK